MTEKIDFAGQFKQGRTADEIMQAVLAGATVTKGQPKTRDELFQSMVEQDVSPVSSPLGDLTLAYNLGEITDEQYAQLFQSYEKQAGAAKG